MSILQQMIACNEPLHNWKNFQPDGRGTWRPKEPEKLAREIFRQLSHINTVELVAKEYNDLDPLVRIQLNQLCNDANCSGTVRKNIQRLDQLVGGKLLRSVKIERFVNQRVESATGARFVKRRVDEAAAAAQRKYATWNRKA